MLLLSISKFGEFDCDATANDLNQPKSHLAEPILLARDGMPVISRDSDHTSIWNAIAGDNVEAS